MGHLSTVLSFLMFPFRFNPVWAGFLVFLPRISRLFSDVKKILLYSQNDKNLEGFKELSQALQLLQERRSGGTAARPGGTQKPETSPPASATQRISCFVSLVCSVFVSAGAVSLPHLLQPAGSSHRRLPPCAGQRGRVLRCSHLVRVQPQQATASSHLSTLAAAAC